MAEKAVPKMKGVQTFPPPPTGGRQDVASGPHPVVQPPPCKKGARGSGYSALGCSACLNNLYLERCCLYRQLIAGAGCGHISPAVSPTAPAKAGRAARNASPRSSRPRSSCSTGAPRERRDPPILRPERMSLRFSRLPSLRSEHVRQTTRSRGASCDRRRLGQTKWAHHFPA